MADGEAAVDAASEADGDAACGPGGSEVKTPLQARQKSTTTTDARPPATRAVRRVANLPIFPVRRKPRPLSAASPADAGSSFSRGSPACTIASPQPVPMAANYTDR
ncbi:hypothetical protein GCM10010443_41810 [Actinoplanes cyaneus]